ncbi:MAG: bifunctional glycosyltransferase family 2/GtrA family protein [Victivallaceae bacterium]|nr:bifunctional glycosyltransferase family 2/GtrA family protein [Victivallaceae bacterium]
MSLSNIAVVIPALNPDRKLLDLVAGLRCTMDNSIIVVDDGSRPGCCEIFNALASTGNLYVLKHCVNQGKGRALKTAFNFFLNENPDGIGVVTCDGDGQHLADDIAACMKKLEAAPASLILGCRRFSGSDVPWKSRFGNNLTGLVFKTVVRLDISDTQTGLRGIPVGFMRELMNVPGERFEFETEMLIAMREFDVKPLEVPIVTVYMDNNRETHFRPVADSLKIYGVIFRGFLRRIMLFGFSGFFSAGVDLGLFALLFYVMTPALGMPRLIWSVAGARTVSLVVNYLLNRHFVFRGKRPKTMFGTASLAGYLLLCAAVMLLSYGMTRSGHWLFPQVNIVIIKLLSDAMLFFLSYTIQRHVIFAVAPKN